MTSAHQLADIEMLAFAWAGVASVLLFFLLWRLGKIRQEVRKLAGMGKQGSLHKALTQLQALVLTRQSLLEQTQRSRDEMLSATRQAEHLKQRQWAAQELFARLDEGVFMARQDGRVFEVNLALENILQRPADLLRERKLAEVLDPEDREFFTQLCTSMGERAHWEGRLILHRADRSRFPAYLRLLSLLDGQGRPQFLLGVLQDLSPMEQTHAKLHQLTHHDPLTGLQNRASFLDEVDAILIANGHRPWMFAVLGVDRFTMVSDTLGPNLGGRILNLLAQRLKAQLTPHDRLAYLGGNEFAWFMPLPEGQSEREIMATWGETMLKLIRQPLELKEPRYTLKLTASLGLALFPRDGRRADDLLQTAHLALMHAQQEGGDRILLHAEWMSMQVARRFQIEQGLRSALERREIECALHPLVMGQKGQLSGFEALMRWRRADGQSISPAEFIPVAEETGLIIPLTHWLLDQACQHLHSWRTRSGKPLLLSLNISPRQLLDPTLAEMLVRTLQKYRLDPTALMLEITESGLVGSIDLVRERILQLAMRGFLIAVDDFGTGHSTLSLLNELPIDKLKIDQSFIRDRIPEDVEAVKIVEAMLALAKGLQLAVVVEGIETVEQAQFIRQRLPTALLQGFLFGPPQPLHVWDGLLLEGKLPSYDLGKEKGA